MPHADEGMMVMSHESDTQSACVKVSKVGTYVHASRDTVSSGTQCNAHDMRAQGIQYLRFHNPASMPLGWQSDRQAKVSTHMARTESWCNAQSV